MKRLLMLIPLVFLCCLGCQQSEQLVSADGGESPKWAPDGSEIYFFRNVEADIQTIKDIVAEMNSAMNASDIDRYLKLYADDAVEIQPNEPAYIGKDAIRSRDQDMFNEMTLQDVYTVEDVKVRDDLAVAHFAWSTIATFKADGKTDKTQGNWIMVFEKQSDGVWKIIYSIWSDEGLIRPPLPE